MGGSFRARAGVRIGYLGGSFSAGGGEVVEDIWVAVLFGGGEDIWVAVLAG